MIRALMLSVVLAFPLGQAAPFAAAQEREDVRTEWAIRSAAFSLAKGEAPPWEEAGLKPSWNSDWVTEAAWLEAHERAGVMLSNSELLAVDVERVELAAARLRVLSAAEPRFFAEIERALDSPWRALRQAAIGRLAAASVEVSVDRARLRRVLASAEIRDESTRRLVLEVGLRTYDPPAVARGGRPLDALFASSAARDRARERDRASRRDGGEGWPPALAHFEDLVAQPLTAEEIERLASIRSAAGGMALVALVAKVRDGLRTPLVSGLASAGAAAELLASGRSDGPSLDAYELDVIAEAFVDALRARGARDEAGSQPDGWRGEIASACRAAALRHEGQSDGYLRVLRVMAQLVPVERALELATGLDEDGALEIWDVLDRRDRWSRGPETAAALRPWVTDARASVREAAVRAVGRRFAHEGYLQLRPLVTQALTDERAALRSFAFAWLAAAPQPETTEERDALDAALRSAFDAERPQAQGGRPEALRSPPGLLSGLLPGLLSERQGRWLAQLPRTVAPRAFRDVLLGVLAVSGTSSEAVGASSLELLGAFRGDEEIAARVRILLERSLRGLEAAGGYLERLPFDSEAARAVRILHGVDPLGSVPELDAALRRAMGRLHGEDARGDARPQLPKTTAALLARTKPGRARLSKYLAGDVPRRVRFEAALQLARLGDDREQAAACAAALIEEYRGVDGALRLRALRALADPRLLNAEAGIDRFLGQLSRGPGDHSERLAAIEALGERRRVGALLEVMDHALMTPGVDAAGIDAAAAAARALGAASPAPGDPATLDAVLARLRSPQLVERERSALATVRGGLLKSLAALSLGASSARGLDEILRVPLEAASQNTIAGFGRERRIEPQFLWASELAALRTLGRAPGAASLAGSKLRLAIGPRDRWLRLDGRLQLAVARVAQEAGAHDLSADLALGATIALQGEGRAQDHVRRLAEARWLHGAAALAANRPREAATSLAALLAAHATGEPSRSVLRAMVPSVERPEVEARVRYFRALDPALDPALRAWVALLPGV